MGVGIAFGKIVRYNKIRKGDAIVMAFLFGKNVRYYLFGEAHSEYIGMVMEGLPADEYIDPYDVKEFVSRCFLKEPISRFGKNHSCEVEFLSGVTEYRTCGTPLCAVMANASAENEPRGKEAEGGLLPSETEIALWLQQGAEMICSDGGSYHERIFSALCIGGAIAKKLLEKRNIVVGAHVETIGSIHDRPFDPMRVTDEELKDPGRYPFPTLNYSVGETMRAQIESVAKKGDSIGGVVECGVVGLPGGVGNPPFGSLSGELSANLFAVPCVVGVEFGNGFRSSAQRGSMRKFALRGKDGRLSSENNGTGGVIGGVSTGMPLIFRVAMQPPLCIPGDWDSLHIDSGEDVSLTTMRHTPCFVPQMVPVVESLAAMTILDLLMVK